MHNKKRLLFLIPAILVFSLAFLAVVGFFGLEYYTTSVLKKEMDRQIREISDYIRVDYDSLGVNWLAFTVDMHKVRLSKPPLPGYVTIGKVAVRDFTSIGLNFMPTVVRLSDIVLTDEHIKITASNLVTSFSLKKIPAQEEIDRGWQALLENLSDGEVRLADLTFSGQSTQLNIAKVAADYSVSAENQRNFGVKLHALTIHDGELTVTFDTFSLSASLDPNHVPIRLAQQVKDFIFKFPPGPAGSNPFLQQLASLGYDRLNFGMNLNYDYQPETQNLNIAWDGKAQDLGRLQFELHLTDYQSPPVPVNGSLAGLLDYLERLGSPVQNASLQGFKATYQDFGLAPRLIKAEAETLGQSPQEFSQGLVSSINNTIGMLPLPAAIRDQVKAVNRFILNPQEIQLTVNCKKPVGLKSLRNGSVSGFLELLGNTEIKITSK